MLRKLFILSEDKVFTERVKMLSLMLTKLNYFIDLKITSTKENILPGKNAFYIIIDMDSPETISYIKKIRSTEETKSGKIIALYSKENNEIKNEAFHSGCDAVMIKEEFLNAFDSIMR